MLNLSETQTRRVYQARAHLAEKYCEFMDSYRFEPIRAMRKFR